MTSWPGMAGLCRGLFDDASMFPPEASFLTDALAGYGSHRSGWYRDMVGSFVCQTARLRALDLCAERHGVDRVEVSMVVPGGLTDVPGALASVRDLLRIDVRAIEVPLGARPLPKAIEVLAPSVTADRAVYLEVDASSLTESVVHRLAPSGVRLKLRTGGTSIDAFRPEVDLARVIVLCGAERLAFKCSAGLRHAVRHRDSETLRNHHGFLNIALAVRTAAATGNVRSTQSVLAETDVRSVAHQVWDLSPDDVSAIRAMLSSIVTFNITDSVTDLVALGLVNRP